MCDIVFEKVQGCAGKVNRTSVYAEAAFRRVPIKGFMRYFSEFTKKHQCRNLFFDKVKLSRSKNFIKIESLEQVFAKLNRCLRNLKNLLEHLFRRAPPDDCYWLLLRFNSCFQKSPEQKPVRLSAINAIFKLQKCICCYKNSGVLKKKVCSFIIRTRSQYCEVFKNIYFQKHLWAAASENQHLSDKFRSSRPEVFCKKVFLEILQNSQ